MTDTSPQRFMFGTSFDPEVMKAAKEKKPALTFTEEEMAVAKEQAYGQGFVAGKEAAMRELQNQQNELLANIQGLFERLAIHVFASFAQQKQAACDIAITIARKIVPDYVRKHGQQEIVAAIESSVTEMINEPRLVLRISEAQFDDISREMNTLSSRVGYGGKLIILADNTLAQHDCRLEWADGGMERSVNLLWSEIEKHMHRHQSTSQQTPHSPSDYVNAIVDTNHPAPPTTTLAV